MIKRIVSGGYGDCISHNESDSTIRLWDANTGRTLLTLSNHGYRYSLFSPDGKQILLGGNDSVLILNIEQAQAAYLDQQQRIFGEKRTKGNSIEQIWSEFRSLDDY